MAEQGVDEALELVKAALPLVYGLLAFFILLSHHAPHLKYN